NQNHRVIRKRIRPKESPPQETEEIHSAEPQNSDEPAIIEADPEPAPEQVSERKIESNRRNAQLSSGPRSAQGKKSSSQNAIKLGLTSNFLITRGPLREDPEQFAQLLAHF